MLKLQCYDVILQWTPQRYMKLADALSKLHTNSDHRFHVDVIYHINSIINDIPISDEIWGELRQQTRQDNSIMEVITLLKEGK